MMEDFSHAAPGCGEGPRLTFLGTGTSSGVPMIGCGCEVCRSKDPRDSRLRSSALVQWQGKNILIDAGPDFRYQMLRSGISHLDAILLTHNHKDHTGGLDDVRAMNYFEGKPVDIWCEDYVLESLKMEYSYAFAKEKYPGAPEWVIHRLDGSPFEVCGLPVIPIRGWHYRLPVLGFRFAGIAYCTDMNRLDESEMEKLRGLKHFTINTVGYRKHISHFNLSEALEICEKVGAQHSWLTHLSHRLPLHAEFRPDVPGVLPAYDGLTIE